MTSVDDIQKAVSQLPPEELAKFRAWFAAFEASRPDAASALETTATKLGRLAGRTIAEFRKRNPPTT